MGHPPFPERLGFIPGDIVVALSAVELGLSELGAEIERGAALTAALAAYEQPVAV